MLKIYRNYALIKGVYLGALLCFFTLFFYFFDQSILFSKSHSISLLCVIVLFPLYVLYDVPSPLYRFKDIFSVIFLTLASASFLYVICTFILYNFINLNHKIHGLTGLIFAVDLDAFVFGNQEFSHDWVHQFSFTAQFNSYIFWLMPCTLYSALISLLMKIIKL